MQNLKTGALASTWLYILGHLAAIDQLAQILAFLAAAGVSCLTIIDWIRNRMKNKDKS